MTGDITKLDIYNRIDEKSRIYWILFGLITLLFVVTRLFRLDQVPFTSYGMHFDEMSAAYDAWCIQGWGVDRHMTRFPVYFMNTGPGQNALYIYLAAVMFKIFGFSLFKFRLIAVICASGAYGCLFFLARRLLGNGIFSLAPNALMVVMPVFLMSEHWGLESYLFLSFVIISFFFLILSLEKRKARYYILDGILWGVTFYTYGVSYVVIPLFFLMAAFYLLYVKQMDVKMALATAAPMMVLGFPLAVEQLVIQGLIAPFSFIWMDFFPMEISRVKEISFAYIPQNICSSFWTLFIKDYLSYSSVPMFGTIFYVSMPFMLIGMVVSIGKTVRSLRTKCFENIVLIVLFFLAGWIVLLMTDDVNTNKANEIYFPCLIFTAIGIRDLCKKTGKKWVLLIIVILYMVSFIPFARWIYSGGENSWSYQTRPKLEEYIVEDIHPGLAVGEAKKICGNRELQMMINGVSGRYLQICLFAGTSPYDYNSDGYEENGYYIGFKDEFDLSGETVYLIEDDLSHITEYLVDEGFTNRVAEQGGFSILYK